MIGNDQKSVWEYHLGAETIHFGDLGCAGRYSDVLEGDFHVDFHQFFFRLHAESQGGCGGEKIN